MRKRWYFAPIVVGLETLSTCGLILTFIIDERFIFLFIMSLTLFGGFWMISNDRNHHSATNGS